MLVSPGVVIARAHVSGTSMATLKEVTRVMEGEGTASRDSCSRFDLCNKQTGSSISNHGNWRGARSPGVLGRPGRDSPLGGWGRGCPIVEIAVSPTRRNRSDPRPAQECLRGARRRRNSPQRGDCPPGCGALNLWELRCLMFPHRNRRSARARHFIHRSHHRLERPALTWSRFFRARGSRRSQVHQSFGRGLSPRFRWCPRAALI